MANANSPISYFALYVALYGAFGVASPFLPKFLETKGLSTAEIALIFGAALLIRLISGPLVGSLTDLLDAPRIILAFCAGLAAAASLSLLGAHTFWLLLVLVLVQAAALSPTTSIADALSLNRANIQIAGARFEYGWVRGAGSAAFVLGTLTIGQLISSTDLTPVIWSSAALLLAAAGASTLLQMPMTEPEPRIKKSVDVKDFGRLLNIPRFRTLILVAALVFGSHAMNDTFAVIRWSDAGLSASTISFLWSESVAAEVAVFLLVGPMLLERLGERRTATLAVAAAIVRWTVEGTTNSVWTLSLMQPMHGLTFALLHLACMRMIGAAVPRNLAATAQSVYGLASGVMTAGVTLTSGALYARYGGAAFFSMAALCAVALPFAWFGLR